MKMFDLFGLYLHFHPFFPTSHSCGLGLEQDGETLTGPCWADTVPPARKLLPDEEFERGGSAQMIDASLDSLDESPVGPGAVSYTVERTSQGSEGHKTPVQAGMTTEQMVAVSPARRRNSIKVTDYSRAKISEMSERILDTQTTEYYKWGESA